MSGINSKLYTVKELQDIIPLKKNKIYQLVNSEGFPSLRIGGTILVDSKALDKWIQNNLGKTFLLD